MAEGYARPLLDTSIPIGMVIGNLIIVLSIVLSVAYIRIVNRIEDGIAQNQRTPE